MTRAHYLLKELGTQLQNLREGTPFPGRILIVDEEGEDYGQSLASILPACRITVVACPKMAKRHFISSPTDLVVLNHSRGVSCLELLPAFKACHPSVPVVVVTGCGSEDLAIQAFRHGAIDYFHKPFDVRDLELTLRAILDLRRKQKEQESSLPVGGTHKALLFIEANFHASLKLDQVARAGGMSVSCFERHLKKQTGMTFVAYVNNLRVARARELLQVTSASMLQIALSCGFGNQSHFNRVFKKLTGCTPGDCRKENTYRR